MKSVILVLSATFALAACGDGTQTAEMSAEEAEANGNIVGNSSASKPVDEPPAAEAPSPGEIPVAIRGRWGLVSADCEPGRDDAKGLLTISAGGLEFYESVGLLDGLIESEPTRIRGSFEFTGEGMTWERDVVLDVQDEGRTLIRREYGEDAAPGPFRYTKCS